jgi:hypothetical protein
VNEIKIKTISENKNRSTGLLLSSGLQNVLPQRELQKNESIFYIIIGDRLIHKETKTRPKQQGKERTELAKIASNQHEGMSFRRRLLALLGMGLPHYLLKLGSG